MGLPAMMGLMIEQMLEYVRNGLGVGHARCRPVTVDACQRSVVIRIDRADEPFILNYARSDKLGAIFEQDSIQSAWMVALTGQWWLDARKPKKDEVAAHLVNLAWNGLSHLEAKPRLRTRR